MTYTYIVGSYSSAKISNNSIAVLHFFESLKDFLCRYCIRHSYVGLYRYHAACYDVCSVIVVSVKCKSCDDF